MVGAGRLSGSASFPLQILCRFFEVGGRFGEQVHLHADLGPRGLGLSPEGPLEDVLEVEQDVVLVDCNGE